MIDAMHGRVQALLADQPASFLRVYHTILDNGTFDVLRQWIDAGETYIGLGVEAIPYLDAIFRITRDQIRVHGFALSRHNILSRYPFYSVDSSTALATTRFGGYMRADFSFKSRKRCLRDRDVNIVRSEEARIHLALEAAARFQAHYTELWERRGVTWPET
jgi:hypothetical protein